MLHPIGTLRACAPATGALLLTIAVLLLLASDDLLAGATRHFAHLQKRLSLPSSPSSSSSSAPPRGRLFVYEKNMKTGSTSWDVMLRGGGGGLKVSDCEKSLVENSLNVPRFAARSAGRDALVSCHVRRMAIPRTTDARILTSFNLEKDMVLSAYLQEKNLTAATYDRMSDDFVRFKREFRIFWALIYMGYAGFEDSVVGSATCPLTAVLHELVQVAVKDTFLPITHDLPCMSRTLLRKEVGVVIKKEVRLNVRNGLARQADWVLEKSCVDIELSRLLTQKMVRMYDGTEMDAGDGWRERARAKDKECDRGFG